MSEDFTDVTPKAVAPVDLALLQRLNTIGVISYVLHLLVAVAAMVPGAQFGTTLLIVALLIDWTQRDSAEGTWHASHFRYRIRSVVTAGVLYLVTLPLWALLLLPGMIAWIIISVWFLYRIATGFIAMNKGQEIHA
ncbi:hypothetical protein RQP54_01615 [Curvibacter sp. APW13]|uniref:DUF4870 family protein n=1 Tax=Curvibacter sp. APW13 TaxID=3077236 RepID=UPI0028DFFE68|nr:hypothetical protein [Curvibacter sp. APW13]MDT8989553.1 hypothetical protein [Curvibacter sp. APW13]